MSLPKTESEHQVDLESLTWTDVAHWTTKNYDFGYDVSVLYQPGYITDHRIATSFHAEGKPYSIWINYCVIGHQLLIWRKRHGQEFTDFLSHEVIELRNIDLMTQPVVNRKQSGFLFVSEHPVYAGEQFYYISSDPAMPAYMKAFTLRFPESEIVYQWEDAVKFSSSLKWRVNKLRSSNPDSDDKVA